MKVNWFYFWRKIHALFECKYAEGEFVTRSLEWGIDVGYCLDRYGEFDGHT